MLLERGDVPEGNARGRACHVALELGFLGGDVDGDAPLCLQLREPGLRRHEEVCGEGVEVLLVLEARRVEVLRDQVEVQLAHRRHRMEASTQRREVWLSLAQPIAHPRCEARHGTHLVRVRLGLGLGFGFGFGFGLGLGLGLMARHGAHQGQVLRVQCTRPAELRSRQDEQVPPRLHGAHGNMVTGSRGGQ
eukprot:scaffold53253_cov65-Phaeocystis_antarctica.AAC.8